MSKKILIVSASTGSGHIRAAEAIEKKLKKEGKKVNHIDMIEYVSLPMKTAVVNSYTLLANKLPELWGFLYKKSNNKKLKERFNKLTKKLKKINSTRLYNYIEEYNPDKIICTHFLPAEIIVSRPRAAEKVEIELQITDYGLHELWLVEGVSKYRVATEKIKWQLQRKGVNKDVIKVSGIPVDPVFNKEYDQKKVKESLELKSNKPTVLILSGGQGLGHITQIVDLLLEAEKNINLVAIAGKNKKLESELKKKQKNKVSNYHPIGWTNEIDKYLKAADVVISKPGGMTTSECIALKKPLIIANPIPGQEEANAEYIVNNDYGYLVSGIEDILYYVEKEASITTR